VDGTRIVGAHFFTMSNAASEEALLGEFDQAAEAAVRLAELGLAMDYVDIGGGFAAPYATPGERSAYPGLRGGLEAVLDARLPGWRAGSPELACESGRSLVAGAGSLLCRVVNVKTSRDSTFVILDGGINILGGLSGIGRLLPAAVQVDDAALTETANLAGPLCTPGDLLGRGVRVPKLAVGDLVTIPNTGAYGTTASLLHFLSRPAPAEVVLDGGEVVSATRLESRRVAVDTAVPVGAA
jgi:diaminopimelate decarboxylase